jgi:hypothetical protein
MTDHRSVPHPPVASRRALNGAFLTALVHDFDSYGAGAIAALRELNPGRYLELIASLQPPRNEPEAPPAQPAAPPDAAARERQVLAELDAVFHAPARDRAAPRKAATRKAPG